MKKKFVTNLILLLSLNILIKPFWVFGIDRTVQNVVGAGEYGLYFSLFNFSLLLNILLDFGITNFNNREISRHPKVLPGYFSNIVGLKLFLAVIYGIVSFLVAMIIGYEEVQMRLLLPLIFNQFLASFIMYLRSNISGLQMFKTDSFLSVLDRVVMILLCAILLWTDILGGEFKIEWFIYAQTVAYLLAVFVAFVIVLRKANFIKPRLNIVFIRRIMRKSYPFALLTILMSIYYRVDSVMLERMLPDGAVQAGIYAQAFRILDAFTMFAFLFATLLLPMFSRMIKKGEPVEELSVFSFLLLMIPVLIVSVSLVFYRLEFMEILYNEHTAESSKILAVLMFAHIFVSITYISGTLLTAGGHLSALNITAVSGLVLNVVLNIFLIPKYHALGSASASLLTQMLVVVIQSVLVFRLFKFGNYQKVLLKLFLFTLFVVVFAWISTQMDFSWLLRIFIVMTVSMIVAMLSGLIRIRVLMSLFQPGEEKPASFKERFNSRS